jgi:hypothetical protein
MSNLIGNLMKIVKKPSLNVTKLKPWPSLNKCTNCELAYHKDNMSFVINVVCFMIIFLT